jgi:hypothetical protein
MDEEPPGRAWALPGTAAGEGADAGVVATPPTEATGAAADGRGDERGVARRDEFDVPVLGLRPMTVADVLDGGFAVLKARPRRILGLVAAFVIPAQLLIAFLERSALGGRTVVELWTSDPTVLNETADTNQAEQLAGTVLQLVLPAIALVFLAAAIAHLVSAWSVGHDPSGREMLSVAGRRWWPLLASFVLVKAAEAVGVLGCYVGAVFVMPLFVAVAPVIGVEAVGPVAALQRSARLTGHRYWPVLGIALLMAVVSALIGQAIAALPLGLAAWVGFDSGWPLVALGSIVRDMVVLPFVAAATVLLYLDLRVRSEGLDIELDALDVFGRVA